MNFDPIYAQTWGSLCSKTVERAIKGASGKRWFSQASGQCAPYLLLFDGVDCFVTLYVKLAVKNFPGEACAGARSLRLIGSCKAIVSAPEGPQHFSGEAKSDFDLVVNAQSNPDVSMPLDAALAEILVQLQSQPIFTARFEAAEINRAALQAVPAISGRRRVSL